MVSSLSPHGTVGLYRVTGPLDSRSSTPPVGHLLGSEDQREESFDEPSSLVVSASIAGSSFPSASNHDAM